MPRGGFSAKEEILSSGDAELDSILDRLEVKGKAVKDLRARIKKEQIETFPVPETQVEEGLLLFGRFEPEPKFQVRFDRFVAGGIVRDKPQDRHWFTFDGRWLVERNARTRRVIRREAVKAGERIDVFKLGNGPFPLPIGQSRRDMLSNFKIVRVPPKGGDPSGSDHFACTPLVGSELHARYKQVDFYVDRKLELPTRIDVVRRKDDLEIRVTFDQLEVNVGLAASEFEMPVPADYAVTIEALESAD